MDITANIAIFNHAAKTLEDQQNQGLATLQKRGVANTNELDFATGNLVTKQITQGLSASVLRAFVAELTLKAILKERKGYGLREFQKISHNLKKGFNALDEDCQRRIKANTMARANINDQQFNDLLENNERIFETGRYIYEHENLNWGPRFLQIFSEVLMADLGIQY